MNLCSFLLGIITLVIMLTKITYKFYLKVQGFIVQYDSMYYEKGWEL